jgi:hypothetical protein
MDYINVRSLGTEKADIESRRDRMLAELADVGKSLSQPGLAVDERHYLTNKQRLIQRHLIAVRNDIAVLSRRIWWHSVDVTVFSVVGAAWIGSAWWTIYPGYCVWRHKTKRAYTPRQIQLRQRIFDPRFPSHIDAAAQRGPQRANDLSFALLLFYASVNFYVGMRGCIDLSDSPSSPHARRE